MAGEAGAQRVGGPEPAAGGDGADRQVRVLEQLPGPVDALLGVPLPAAVRDRVLPALADAGCFAAVRGASLRLAPHLHTDDADIDRLVAALGTARR